MTLFESQHPWELRPAAERERAEQYRPVSVYDCLSFLLSIMSVFAFIFALIFISFICSSPSPCLLCAVRSLCVCVKVYIFICFDSKLDVFMTRLDSK